MPRVHSSDQERQDRGQNPELPDFKVPIISHKDQSRGKAQGEHDSFQPSCGFQITTWLWASL